MNGRRILAAAFVVAILTTGCAAAAAPQASPVSVVPSTAPTPTAAPSVAAASTAPSAGVAFDCDGDTVGCAGPLAAGTHESAQFEQPFSFTVPAGWTNIRDIYRAYALTSAAAPDQEFIVWTRSAPAKQRPDCGPARREGFGTSVSEWMRALTTDDRLDVSKPEVFQLGTHQATRVVVKTRSTFNVICPDNTDPFADIVTDTEIPPTRVHGGQGGAMTFIDFGDDAVLIWNDGEAMVDSVALPVIKTMRFKN